MSQKTLGLQNKYKRTESPVGNWLKQVFGWLVLLLQDIEEAFVYDLTPEAPDPEQVSDFPDYMLEKHIAPNARFPL